MSNELTSKLRKLSGNAFKFFYLLEYFLEKSVPYGTLQYDVHDLSRMLKVSKDRAYQAMAELKKAKIIVQEDGVYKCQYLIRAKIRRELKEIMDRRKD